MQLIHMFRRLLATSSLGVGLGLSAAFGSGMVLTLTASSTASLSQTKTSIAQDGERGQDGRDDEGARGKDGQDGERAADLPAADEVLARYVEAIGGKDRISEVESMTQKGTMEIRAVGVNGAFTLRSATPQRMHMAMEFEGMGKIETGFDGKVGWRVDPNMGPVLLNETEIEQVKIEADPQSPANMAKHYPKRKTVQRTEFEATDVYELEMETKAGQVFTMYFGVENGLLLGQRGWQDTQMGRIEMSIVLSDYRDFDGWKMPTTMTMTQGGMPMVMHIEDVTFNDVDESAFEIPAPIKRLVEVRDREDKDGDHPNGEHPRGDHPRE